MFTFHHGHVVPRRSNRFVVCAAPGRCCEHARQGQIIHYLHVRYTSSSHYAYIVPSHRTSLFIITRVAPRARNVLLVLLRVDRRLITGTSSFTHCRCSSSYQQEVIVDHEQQGIRASSSTRVRAVVAVLLRCARSLVVLVYMSSYVSG